MRYSKPEVIINEAGKICTIVLNASYCAEQERGIQPILEVFGINVAHSSDVDVYPESYTGPWGFERIKSSGGVVPGEYMLFSKSKETKASRPVGVLGVATYMYSRFKQMFDKPATINKHNPEGALISVSKKVTEDLTLSGAAWDENGFILYSCDPAVIEFMEEVYNEAIGKGHNLAIWLGGAGNNPFARNGLCIGLIDRIPKEHQETMTESEKATHRLYCAAKKTGIPDLIPANMYYALVPGKVLKERKLDGKLQVPDTKHPVMFYLNPREQKKNNSGWYTVEELKDWIEGKGPIPNK